MRASQDSARIDRASVDRASVDNIRTRRCYHRRRLRSDAVRFVAGVMTLLAASGRAAADPPMRRRRRRRAGGQRRCAHPGGARHPGSSHVRHARGADGSGFGASASYSLHRTRATPPSPCARPSSRPRGVPPLPSWWPSPPGSLGPLARLRPSRAPRRSMPWPWSSPSPWTRHRSRRAPPMPGRDPSGADPAGSRPSAPEASPRAPAAEHPAVEPKETAPQIARPPPLAALAARQPVARYAFGVTAGALFGPAPRALPAVGAFVSAEIDRGSVWSPALGLSARHGARDGSSNPAAPPDSRSTP